MEGVEDGKQPWGELERVGPDPGALGRTWATLRKVHMPNKHVR